MSGLGPAALDLILWTGGIDDIGLEARKELAAELESIRSLYLTGKDMRWKPARQEQEITRITAAARHIMELIDAGYPWLAHHRAALNRLIADAERGLFPPEITTVVGLHTESAFDNLVGLLYRAFAGYCEKVKPGFTTDPGSGEVSGPFVAMVDAALRELQITAVDGLPYSRRTIAAAITSLKHKLR